MDRLKGVAIVMALALAHPAAARDLARWRPHIEEASARFGIPVSWIERVIVRESDGETALGGRPIVSHAGAMGLMQLMPGTWAQMRRELGLGGDPHAPRDNILAGTRYLRLMYDRFGFPGLFAAYNAGPDRYARHLATGRPLPEETRAYLAALSGERRTQMRAATVLPPPETGRAAAIFFKLGAQGAAGADRLPGGVAARSDEPR